MLHRTAMTQVPSVPGPGQAEAAAITDKSNPRSIINLVSGSVAKAIDEALFTNPEYFRLDDRALAKLLRSQERSVNPTDNRLRLKFWFEYDRVQELNLAHMNIGSVCAGVCSRDYFEITYLKHAHKVAWLVCPPTEYMIRGEEALAFGLEQMRDILEEPHVIGGRVDTKLASLKAKIVAMLDTRIRGAVVQKTLQLQGNISEKAALAAVSGLSMEELQRQMKELDRRNRMAQNIPLLGESNKPVIDLEPS